MRKVTSVFGRPNWQGLQSGWVLPTARRLYLTSAVAAALVAALALIVALLFQFGTIGSAATEPVPDVTAPAAKDISVESLDSLFAGPQNIRAEPQSLTSPVHVGDEVAKLTADSLNGIGEFELIGGDGADLVTEDYGSSGNGGRLVKGLVLRATEKLATRLNAPGGVATRANFPVQLRVVAKDQNGNLSAPTNVGFRVRFRDPGQTDDSRSAGRQESDVRESISGPEGVRNVAVALASIAAAKGTPEWIDAYKYAVAESARCNAGDSAQFVRQYNSAFRHLRKRLTASNLGTFYNGLCEGWASTLAGAEAEANIQNTRRAEVISRNTLSEAKTAARKAAARLVRDAALGVALIAIALFMVVALFLAFLAIESHSSAIQTALSVIAERRSEPQHA